MKSILLSIFFFGAPNTITSNLCSLAQARALERQRRTQFLILLHFIIISFEFAKLITMIFFSRCLRHSLQYASMGEMNLWVLRHAN